MNSLEDLHCHRTQSKCDVHVVLKVSVMPRNFDDLRTIFRIISTVISAGVQDDYQGLCDVHDVFIG